MELTRFQGAAPVTQPVYAGVEPIGFHRDGRPIWPMRGAATGMYARLMDERATLSKEVVALQTAADADGRDFTDEERARLDAIASRRNVIEQDVARLEAFREEIRHATPVADPVDAAAAPKPFRSLGEQLQAVRNAALYPHAIDPRLMTINAAATGANELLGSDGGFAVQVDYEQALMQRVYQTSILASRCAVREVGPQSNGVKYNIIDETSRATGSRWGGVRAYWTAEAGALTGSRPKYAVQELTLQKLTGLYYATDELMADAVALQSFVESAFAQEFGFQLDDAIVRGTGAGMPQGLLNAAATVSATKETGQIAATFVAENVEKMYARLWAPSVGKAAWFINQNVWPQIFQLNHAIGTGGVPMFIPAGGLTDSPAGLLLGRPIIPIEQCASVGTQGDVILADLSQYTLIRKGGIVPASSIHVAFTTDEMAFRWTMRTNGKSEWLAALTPFKGSGTLSPFVVLDTRS